VQCHAPFFAAGQPKAMEGPGATPGCFTGNVTAEVYLGGMSKDTRNPAGDRSVHPQQGRRYTIEELTELADQGDAWAIGKVDEWEQHFADVYKGNLRDTCPDDDCEHFGEPVDICYGEDGAVLDIDHGGWGHGPARDEQGQKKAS